jgi:hypothetical protein
MRANRRTQEGRRTPRPLHANGGLKREVRFSRRYNYRNSILIPGINIAIVAGAVLLSVTAESTPTLECTKVFKERFGIAQSGRDNIRVEIDQMRIIRKTIARGCLGR